jgi:predicted component of type VI protein secretion system
MFWKGGKPAQNGLSSKSWVGLWPYSALPFAKVGKAELAWLEF